ncbi:MAG: SprT-like domain-containing protein [Aristaeellaceae bacterium]
MKWDEAMIRKELQRLDALTGLHGNDLIVEFGQAKLQVGSFWVVDGAPRKFRFSRIYFEDENFSVHEAYEVIRHEYAHYMNYELHGDSMDGCHGKMWKECCRRIGARPSRYYDSTANQVYLAKEREERQIEQTLDAFHTDLKSGDQIIHPTFGAGTVEAMERLEKDTRLVIAFASGTKKTLSARWVIDHCETGRSLKEA